MSVPVDREKIVATEFRRHEKRVANYHLAKEEAVKKFEDDPLQFLSWSCPALIRAKYEAELAAYMLDAPHRTAELLLVGLNELHRRELRAQLRFSGSRSSSAFSNALDSAVAEARGQLLQDGFISKEYIAELTETLNDK